MVYNAKDFARTLFDEVWSQGRLELLDGLIDPTYHGVEPIVGKVDGSGLRQMIALFRKSFPDLHFELHDVIAEGDKAVIRWTGQGTNTAALMGLAPTGKFASVDGLTYIELRDGRCVRDFTQYDVLAFYRNLGVELPKQMVVPMAGGQVGHELRH